MSHFKDFIYAIIRPVVRSIFRRPNDVRNVLLAAEFSLTADYLAEFWEIMRGDSRLRFFYTLKDHEHSPGDWEKIRKLLPMTHISRRMANLRRWDLVVLANHPGYFKRLANPAQHVVLRIPHGISGKSYKGVNYYYDPQYLYDPKGIPFYSCIFESSHVSRLEAIERDPRLLNKIVVVGNPRIDQISYALKDRKALCSGPAYASSRPVVMLASSWGPNSLFIRIGEELFKHAKGILADYDLVLRPHPHMYNIRICGGKDWSVIFNRLLDLGFRLSPPEQSLAEVIASCDVAVVDDLSSVAMYTAAVDRRLVLVRSNPSGKETSAAQIGEGTFPDRLSRIVPTIDSASELATALKEVLSDWPPAGLAAIQAEINGEPGRSSKLIRQEVLRLLKLTDPASS